MENSFIIQNKQQSYKILDIEILFSKSIITFEVKHQTTQMNIFTSMSRSVKHTIYTGSTCGELLFGQWIPPARHNLK